ncbi:wall-associated receptor kinase 17-like [Spinacia oleracea]|uniref:Wall-associated receptor kinase 17-like n=1 Tax=Spinacia oleracea TaxID=3562 RepID=A0A9R0IJ55_SPIOL|nr:wall-associated receptor kinase 17-like [Spinacia oleracea]
MSALEIVMGASLVVILASTVIQASYVTPLTMLTAPNISREGCQPKCGNLTIPYPFGIGGVEGFAGCFISSMFQIDCNSSYDPPRAIISSIKDHNNNSIEIVDISETQIRIKNQVAYNCFNSTTKTSPLGSNVQSINFDHTTEEIPFALSNKSNTLIVVGCDDNAGASGDLAALSSTSISSSCRSHAKDVVAGKCHGIGCNQNDVTVRKMSYTLSLGSTKNHTSSLSYNPCGYAFLGNTQQFKFRGVSDLNDPNFLTRITNDLPIVLDWVINGSMCYEAQKDRDSYKCKHNTTCVEVIGTGIGGYRCTCLPGYQGNPYLDPGCYDINECEDPNNNPCSKICINTPGDYNCSCPFGYYGDGKKNGTGCLLRLPEVPVFKIALGATFVVLICGCWMCMAIRKRRIIKKREIFFQKNGGLLLKQLISSNKQDDNEPLKVFSLRELKVATKNFVEETIIGRGGYGTVYKGVLRNHQLVAVKKSKIIDETQIEQFINELVILARIRHPNVVRLLGCCLEAEVPLLVYDFISNGTLYEHIHRPEKPSWYTWTNCLRIARELADVLEHLHSIHIIHRDIKSMNILLDESYTIKLSDFGASRLNPMNHTHLSTVVQGTFGYLDPQYFYSSQLTEKSDVYSYGVVLIELLTRASPTLPERPTEERNCNLAAYFVKCMEENNIFNIWDSSLVVEASQEQLVSIAKLLQKCLSAKGEDRPTMKQIAMELEELL